MAVTSTQRDIAVNGITLHITEQGTGFFCSKLASEADRATHPTARVCDVRDASVPARSWGELARHTWIDQTSATVRSLERSVVRTEDACSTAPGGPIQPPPRGKGLRSSQIDEVQGPGLELLRLTSARRSAKCV